MAMLADRITIGEFARRAGVATSALRYYEQLGLISSTRTAGGQRRYARAMLRRVAFIRAAQTVGLSLDEVRGALARLPDERTPSKTDWNKVSATWIRRVDERIAELERLRETLNSCVGCGCLSLRTCRLSNPDDTAASRGAGARWLIGDTPPSAPAGAVAARGPAA
ncbi:MAG: redox-sensitive transcriptional activator SoxR [Streptosporangiaceae bacterium]|jgi:MerR family transcriptional regulator, redox-sensitive transcriptional activator SoxR